MNIIVIVSIALAVLLLIGFLFGFWRSWKKSLIRSGFILVSFVVSLFLTSKISKFLMSKYVNGLVVSFFGKTFDFEQIAGSVSKDLFYEGSALTNLATALLNIVIKLASFLILFLALYIITGIIYLIISAIMSSKKRKESIGTEKVKIWERFIGSGIGIISTLVFCMVLFTPVFGVMNVCNKFLKQDTNNSVSAYNETCLVAGKFYTDNSNIGKVESYLEKYEKLSKSYKTSFAGIVFRFTGVDAAGRGLFNKLSTVNQNGLTVNLTEECVNVINIYNIYKENFVEEKIDLSKESDVEALQEIYGAAKNSEVLRTVIVDIIPNMASKWTNGEKFIGMDIPVSGDMKEIMVDVLEVFNTKEFSILDRNISVMFDSIEVANKYEIISSINNGKGFLDVIDTDGFVYEEIKTLSSTPELKKQLPEIMTTTVKLAYKSAISDPGTKLDQEFTQEKLAQISWENESNLTQTIVTRMFKFFDTEDVIDCLTDFGVVIDTARKSDILSRPVKILMFDYIDIKVENLGNSKLTILNSINNNWDNQNYKYEDLFATVEMTAKIAKNKDSLEMSDMKDTIKSLIENDTSGLVKDTIIESINNGAINSLIDDESKAEVYKEIMLEIVEETDSSTVDQDLQAGQVIVDIINNPKTKEGSMLDNYGNEECTSEEKAEIVIETLISSDNIMNVLDDEATKVENGQKSEMKDYINNLSDSDKTALNLAIGKMNNDNPNKQTLSKLFGN